MRVPTKREAGSTKARMSTLVLGGPPARTTMDRRRRPRPIGLTVARIGRPGYSAALELPPRRGWMDSAARAREAMDGGEAQQAARAEWARDRDRTTAFVLSILSNVPRRYD
jgi:hypothetical protein